MKLFGIVAFTMAIFTFPTFTHQEIKTSKYDDPEYLAQENDWVERKFNSLTEDERIGQLFMIRAHSDKGAEHIASVERMIKDYHVGGLCFFQGTPEKQVELINQYQGLSPKIPIMISMDAEWGLGMRFKSDALSYPRQLMLGAIQDNALIYDMGKQVAKELRRVGTHINFAPVVDVNNNPNNPVINDRSFGEDRYNVTSKSYMYMKGMQDHQVMACAKHFPGHGDTDVDSHLDLPQILHSRARLDSVEMYPFQVLSQHGVQSMMIAHLFIPNIDNTANLPTTLSPKAITEILKGEMNFDGLIFTDGLGMKGVTKHHQPGELEVKALQAGNDVLLLPENVPAAFSKIKEAMNNGTLDIDKINATVKKILKAKYRLGLTSFSPIPVHNVRADVTGPASQIMKRKLIENAITLVRTKESSLPIKDVTKKMASLSIGSTNKTTFQDYLSKYTYLSHFQANNKVSNASTLISKLKDYDEVIVGIHDMSSRSSKNFGIDMATVNFLNQLQSVTKVHLVVFGNPYSLKFFDGIDNVLECYNEDEITQIVAASAVFGAIPIKGKLPITASYKSKYGDGVETESLMRLQYDIPESVGLNSSILAHIDTIAQEAMDQKATPGMQVLVARKGRVVYHQAYGYHTYSKKSKVTKEDIYDVASITKIAATTMSVMKMHDDGEMDINSNMGNCLEDCLGTNKANLNIRDVMSHTARLKPWIPFYENTITKSKKPSKKYYSKTQTAECNICVTQNLYIKESYLPNIWNEIYESELRDTDSYRYSDLGFIMLGRAIAEKSKMGLDNYTYQNFYRPLGMQKTGFNPLNRFSKNQIIPSDEDNYFRRQTIHGNVHDMGAAMMGGVAGHAGLFTDANDLAIFLQMLLNKGYYGGEQYVEPSTLSTFTTRHHKTTRRGLGFDMKETNTAKDCNMSERASYYTYGHTGFTGTAVWVDPQYDLVFIFLTNRTYPNMNNFKLNKLDIRPRIQTVVYEAMEY